MASSRPINGGYHDPSPGATRSRRSSTRRSFLSLSRSHSNQELMRPNFVTDDEGFHVNRAHVKEWQLPDDQLLHRLPAGLQVHLGILGGAGAAVLTGFERLRGHIEDFQGDESESKISDDDLLEHFEGLPAPKLQTPSNAGNTLFKYGLPSPASTGTPVSGSGHATPIEMSITGAHFVTPFSPIALGPSAAGASETRSSSRERSFSTPLEPKDAHFANELAALRTGALVHLRHTVYKIDAEWSATKFKVSADDTTSFEAWWQERKDAHQALEEDGLHLASVHGISSTGLGWTAP